MGSNWGQFPWGQIYFPDWWLPEHFRGILHDANHRAQVPFRQIPLAPLWTPTCCCSHPNATATMLFFFLKKKDHTLKHDCSESRTQRRPTAQWWSPSAALWTFLSRPLRSPFNNAVSFLSHQRHGVSPRRSSSRLVFFPNRFSYLLKFDMGVCFLPSMT